MSRELAEPDSAYFGPSAQLLLDTHVLLWLVSQPALLSDDLLRAIREVSRKRSLLVSVMSVSEIALLVSQGRITLPSPTRQWVESVLARPDLELSPLTPEIAIEANELPVGFDGDPVDRILVATARLGEMTLITRDPVILAYAKQGHVKALPA